MKHINILFILFAAINIQVAFGHMVEFVEDNNYIQAPSEMVTLANSAANAVDFKDRYEISIPKKVNSIGWNRFMLAGKNPTTNNCSIVVNPEWFQKIPEDQQLFLLARSFMLCKDGFLPLSATIIPWIILILTLLTIFGLYVLLGKTKLVHQKKVVRLAIAWWTISFFYLAFIVSLQDKLLEHVIFNYEVDIARQTIEKTQNKDAALQAMEYFDASLKETVKNGETLFAPFVSRFEDTVKILK